MPATNCVGDSLNISINTKTCAFLWLLALLACTLPKSAEKQWCRMSQGTEAGTHCHQGVFFNWSSTITRSYSIWRREDGTSFAWFQVFMRSYLSILIFASQLKDVEAAERWWNKLCREKEIKEQSKPSKKDWDVLQWKVHHGSYLRSFILARVGEVIIPQAMQKSPFS